LTARRSPVDIVLPLVVAAVQLGSAYVVLGTPDLTAARDFLTGTAPTMTDSVAAAQLLLWTMLAAAFAAALLAAVTRTVSAVQAAGGNAIWSVAVVGAGLLILAAGANHRTTSSTVTLSGGSLQEAQAQIRP
jgi:hypothetical protein